MTKAEQTILFVNFPSLNRTINFYFHLLPLNLYVTVFSGIYINTTQKIKMTKCLLAAGYVVGSEFY
jgi:hypothetical protein